MCDIFLKYVLYLHFDYMLIFKNPTIYNKLKNAIL
jgi:hypothetical protein